MQVPSPWPFQTPETQADKFMFVINVPVGGLLLQSTKQTKTKAQHKSHFRKPPWTYWQHSLKAEMGWDRRN